MTNEFSSCTYDQSTWGVSQNIMKYTGYGIHARFQKIFSGGGGGGPNSQKGSDGKFQHGKN